MSSKVFTIAVSMVLALAVGATTTQAALITYDFQAATNPLAPSTVDENLTATAMTPGSGLSTFTVTTGGYPTDPYLKGAPAGGVSTFSWDGVTYRSTGQALANDYVFTFTVTPKPGAEMSLTELSFLAAGGGTSEPPRSVSVFHEGTKLLHENVGTGSDNTRPNMVPMTIDLSGYSQFQTVSTPVTFVFGVSSDGSSKSIEYDNVVLSGVAVPEPASMALVGLGAVLVARRRRH
ncbi:MAG: PEP-CTERM sorting domain-containing protein [Planctomycetota bacterium]